MGELCASCRLALLRTRKTHGDYTQKCALSLAQHTRAALAVTHNTEQQKREQKLKRESQHTLVLPCVCPYSKKRSSQQEREREREKRHVFHVNKKEIRIRAED